MATKQAFMRNIQDRDLLSSFALPAAASSNTTSAAIDTGARSAAGSLPDGIEAVTRIPALSTTIVPNASTVTLSVEQSDDPAFGSGVDVLGTKVLTGAGGAGVAADEYRIAISPHAKRYLRGKVAFGASTTTAASLNGTFQLLF